MIIKTVVIATALVTVPAVSFAFCSERGHQAQSCAPGTVWDADSETCVKQVNS